MRVLLPGYSFLTEFFDEYAVRCTKKMKHSSLEKPDLNDDCSPRDQTLIPDVCFTHMAESRNELFSYINREGVLKYKRPIRSYGDISSSHIPRLIL